jgi:hypothetical protein
MPVGLVPVGAGENMDREYRRVNMLPILCMLYVSM